MGVKSWHSKGEEYKWCERVYFWFTHLPCDAYWQSFATSVPKSVFVCVLVGSFFLPGIKESKQTRYWQHSKAANHCVICDSRSDLHMSQRPTSERIAFLVSYFLCEGKSGFMECWVYSTCHWLLNTYWQNIIGSEKMGKCIQWVLNSTWTMMNKISMQIGHYWPTGLKSFYFNVLR